MVSQRLSSHGLSLPAKPAWVQEELAEIVDQGGQPGRCRGRRDRQMEILVDIGPAAIVPVVGPLRSAQQLFKLGQRGFVDPGRGETAGAALQRLPNGVDV